MYMHGLSGNLVCLPERSVLAERVKRSPSKRRSTCLITLSKKNRELIMKRPRQRVTLPPRISDNDKRRLRITPSQTLIAKLLGMCTYGGSSKHKANPRAFGLPPYQKPRGDETLCDSHANFQPDQMNSIGALLSRGMRAGLIGAVETRGIPSILWTIADNGWIFEGRVSNPAQAVYHGYPVRPSEAIAELVYGRFADWACSCGGVDDRTAAANCKALYGF